MKTLADRIANLPPEKRALLEQRLREKAAARPSFGIRPRSPADGPVPLSISQQIFWFIDQLLPGSALFNIPAAVRLHGKLEIAALKRALQAIVERHSVLRTVMVGNDGVPTQIVSDAPALDVPVIDLADSPDREAELQQVLNAEIARPFDLSRDLMIRALVIRLAAAEHVLILVTHHIASDGWSIEILFRELSLLYRQYREGKPPSLPALPVEFSDYVVWQHQWFQGEILEREISYWKKQLAGIAPLELPTDRPRPPVKSYAGAIQSAMLQAALVRQLTALGRAEGATLFMVLLAAFQTLLYRYTGQHDITVGSPIAGRIRPEIEPLIGCFVNTLVLRGDLSGDPTFVELLRRTREVCLSAYAQQDLPFERLVEELHPERTLGTSPLFQVMFAHENLPAEKLDLPDIRVTPVEVHNGTSLVDLTLITRPDSGGVLATIEYSTDLFDDATISRMLGHLQVLLHGIAAGPNRRLSELPLLSDAERQQLIAWNGTGGKEAGRQTIHGLFEMQAELAPEAVAVVSGEQQLRYGELDRRANQLARHLIKLGVAPGVPVALCMERSLEMIVAVVGILKSGAAYVPLDPAYPPDRLAFMLEDIAAPVLVTDRHSASKIPAHLGLTVSLDPDWQAIAGEAADNPAIEITPGDIACVIYTSGSTGRPKGVEVTHGGLVNYVTHAAEFFGLAPADRVLQFSSISFDTAVEEIFCSLSRGAALVLRNDAMLSSPADFLAACDQWGITVLDLPTAYWHELSKALYFEEAKMPDSIRLAVIGGERALPERFAQWRERIGNRIRLCNSYGPTEATIAATICNLDDDGGTGELPIGRALPNVELYIVDRDFNLAPAGIPGELLIGGAGVARGYRARPDLTAEKFVPNPFSDRSLRLYRTGDLARFRPDGSLEFVGRIDHQVKIRGLRIETEEIESVLRQYAAVSETVVVAREDAPGEKRLVAYVVPHRGHAGNGAELRNFLNTKLPHYMVPSAFVFLDVLPLTPNGKIDRQALPPPDPSRMDLDRTFTAPRTEIEKQLAKIWQDVLKVERVGIHDNFFDIGGHSLIAVRVITQIEKTLGKPVRLSTLFQAPTIEELAGLLGRELKSDSWTSLFAIQPHGSKPPFFWIHGEASDAFLARYLGADQPVYGVMHQGLDGTGLEYTSVETIAAHYLNEIRTVQPRGPYFIGGYCFGGLVGFEIAHRLRAANEPVGLLVMLDPVDLDDCKPLDAGPRTPPASSIAGRVSRHSQALKARGPKERLTYLIERSGAKLKQCPAIIKRVARQAVCRTYLALGRPIPSSLRSFYILGVYGRAMENYLPKKYPGELIVFNAARSTNHPERWAALAGGGFRFHTAPGNHQEVLREHCARAWAEQLKVYLERAQKCYGHRKPPKEKP
ncbi:MAG TPA: amino acid adenylation domain-containing protein [Candidatus Eisenbacteria bacterium]|nr:amino acid adenylation domain-containing protein [Candidatus Eisenbacteria bacterium]